MLPFVRPLLCLGSGLRFVDWWCLLSYDRRGVIFYHLGGAMSQYWIGNF